jgi:hypothetical protein
VAADLVVVRAAIAAAVVAAGGDMAATASGVCGVCVDALPVDGGAFTVMTSDAGRDVLCASDRLIAEIQQVQFSVGEGPALDAFRTARPVLLPDVAAVESTRWPMFTRAVAGLEIGAMFTFPIGLGAITLGVFELYRRRAGRLAPDDLSVVLAVTDLAGSALLALRARQLDGAEDGAWLDGAGSDRRVHQATGMLITQLGVGAEQAFARLRGYAFSNDLLIAAVAEQIVSGDLQLEIDTN